MGGGLMQLVAYGAQDIYLTGNPQITFFKVVYRRHTNFSMETIEQTINGTSILTSSTSTGTVTISRNGDLVHKVYVTSSTSGIQNGDNLIQEVELEIGGQRIDKQTKEWMQVWEELNTPGGIDKRDLSYMKHSHVLGMQALGTELSGTAGHNTVGMVQIPLRFWFCRNPGLALPLIALQYHEVKLKFTWGINATAIGDNFETSVAGNAADCDAVCKVWCDYIYLDTDERRRFAQVSHEYLIEQIQHQSSSGAASVKLNFNHPVKELIWTDTTNSLYGNAKLQLNGHDRFAAQEEEYFQLRQPYDYHTSTPTTNSHGVHDHPWTKSFTSDISGADGAGEFDSDTTTNLDLYMRGTGTKDWYPHEGDKLTLRIIDVSSSVTKASLTTRVTTVGASGSLGHWAHADDSTVNHFVITTEDAWTQGVTFGDGDLLEIDVLERAQVISTCNSLVKEVNCYSFALKPEEHQPSGTCNFSRIDNAKLIFSTASTGTLNIYATNYNVLRIMSGMGGLAYSN
jgi:hypothetical protein